VKVKMPVVLPSSAAEKTWKKSRNFKDHSRKGRKLTQLSLPLFFGSS
jgi:hypothetical protein